MAHGIDQQSIEGKSMEQASQSDASLKLQGILPSWLVGTFYFSGPSHQEHTIVQKDRHLFDGFTQIHSIAIQDQQILYKNRYVENDAYVRFEKTGKLHLEGFGQTYYRSWPKKLFSLLLPELKNNTIPNTSFALSEFYGNVLTQGHLGLIVHDRKTLDIVTTVTNDQKYSYEVPYIYHDPFDNHYIGLQVAYKNKKYGEVVYSLYTLDETFQLKKLSEISGNELRYMHTFCVTQNYIVLILCPLIAKTNNLALGMKAFIKNFAWMPEKSTEFLVIDKKTGKLIKKYSIGSFFCLYQINAFEENENIILDLATYHDAEILTNYYVNKLKVEHQPSAMVTRYVLSNHDIVWSEIINRQPIDYVTCNPHCIGKKYRYVYASEFNPAHTTRNYNYISKIDILTYAVIRWYETHSYPSEPIFISQRDESVEDQGIVVSLVYNSEKNRSFLLFLNAQNMKEIARINFAISLPHPLRGIYISNS